jgi:predicted nuclease of predicted toxin-antitoxin system
MKLLFDENLSPKLSGFLGPLFPDSTHVRECGLRGQSDVDVWEYARAKGFTIVSKDSDLQMRSLLYGHPPKVVWLRIGNCTRKHLIQLIAYHAQDLQTFAADPFESLLVLS